MSIKSKNRRGGFLGSLIRQAIVPFSILGLQQTFRKKRHGNKSTRKIRRFKRTRRQY
jgi:hypothetical protein